MSILLHLLLDVNAQKLNSEKFCLWLDIYVVGKKNLVILKLDQYSQKHEENFLYKWKSNGR